MRRGGERLVNMAAAHASWRRIAPRHKAVWERRRDSICDPEKPESERPCESNRNESSTENSEPSQSIGKGVSVFCLYLSALYFCI